MFGNISLFGGFLFLLIYILPSCIAIARDHKDKLQIILVNIVFGLFLGIGWAIALGWAIFTDAKKTATSS